MQRVAWGDTWADVGIYQDVEGYARIYADRKGCIEVYEVIQVIK